MPLSGHSARFCPVKAERSWLRMTVLAVAIAVRFIPGAASGISYLILAGYALLGPVQAIEALCVSWFMTGVNPGLAGPLAFGAGRFVTLAAATASVFGRNLNSEVRLIVRRPVLFTFLFGVFLILHSIFFSMVVDVSILKAVSWALAACVLISGWARLSQEEANRLIARILNGLTLLMVLSVPLLISPMGFLANGFGFQGLLNQPQLFGVVAGLLGAWRAMRMLVNQHPTWRDAVLALTCGVMAVLSESRTAAIGAAVGLVAAIGVTPFLTRRSLYRALPGLKSPRVHLIVTLGLLFLAFAWSSASGYVETFMTKRGDFSSVEAAYVQSRGVLIEPMLENIQAHPATGIGFGVASLPHRRVADRDNFLGLPVSAAVEKGVAPVAVLEELGVVGSIVTALWLWMIGRRVVRNGAEEIVVVSTILALNLGESFVFSAGGTGLLVLVLIGWAVRPQVGLRGV